MREAHSIGDVARQNDVSVSGDVRTQGQRGGQNIHVAHPGPASDAVTGEAGESLTTSMTGESSLEVHLNRSFAPLRIGDPGWEADSGRPPTKLPLRFRDGVGRVYIFPWEVANTWQVSIDVFFLSCNPDEGWAWKGGIVCSSLRVANQASSRARNIYPRDTKKSGHLLTNRPENADPY